MPKPRDNRLRIFPDRQAAAKAAGECRTARFPKVVPDTLGPETGASASSTPATGDTACPSGAPRR